MKQNRLLLMAFFVASMVALGCSDPKGGESDDVSEFSVDVSNPNGLRDISLISQIGSNTPDTISNIQAGVVKIEIPSFKDSLSIRYSIVSMGYVIVTKEVVLYSDLTLKENSAVVQNAVISAVTEIQKDSTITLISLSSLYEALFHTLDNSGNLAITIRDQDSTKNRTGSLLDSGFNFFNADTAKFVLTSMMERDDLSGETLDKIPEDWGLPKPASEISDSLLFSITGENQLPLLPEVYTLAQVDSMKMFRLKDSVFADSMVEVSPGLLVSRWEVTQKQYFGLMGYAIPEAANENMPITSVSVYDAILYCNLRSQAEGLDPAYTYESVSFMGTRAKGMVNLVVKADANGYRLPTVTEWNIAYTSGILSAGSYYWGNADTPSIVEAYANVSFSNSAKIELVGQRLPTPSGLFDMNGNVAERTIDSEDDIYFSYLGGNYLSDNLEDFEPQILDGARPDVWLGFRVFRYNL